MLTVDILCHGAPSRGVWQKYLDECFDRSQIKNVNFRDKSKIGWSCASCTFTMSDGNKIVSDEYTKLFHNSTILRKSCENCKYSLLPRPADITLGDWWGINEYAPELNDGKGLSLVLANTAKGEAVVAAVAPEARSIQMKENYNNGQLRFGAKLNPNREKFFRMNKKYKYSKVADTICTSHYDVCIVSIFYGMNYGTILVGHSVHKIVEDLGYSVLMLNKPDYIWPGHPTIEGISGDFALKHYNISRIYSNSDDLIWLNKYCDTFLVGSDQLFTPILHIDHAFLDWVELGKNKISFGTSFGRDSYDKSKNDIDRDRHLLDRFNHIALREKSVNLCQNIFNLEDATEVIDPTLIVPVEYWNNLSNEVYMPEAQKSYLLAYMLNLDFAKVGAIKYVAQKLGLDIIYIPDLDKRHRKECGLSPIKEYTPEEFLYLYKNAAFVMTDSYHGTCFSVNFNKPFISIVNRVRGGLRYKLFDDLKVSSRLINTPEEVYDNDALLQPFDFAETNRIVKEKADFAISWLKNALENNNSAEKFTEEEMFLDMQIKELRLKNLENEHKINKMAEQNSELQRTNTLLSLQYRILHKYHFYKFMMLITFGDKKKKYRDKYLKLKPIVKKIRLLIDAEGI